MKRGNPLPKNWVIGFGRGFGLVTDNLGIAKRLAELGCTDIMGKRPDLSKLKRDHHLGMENASLKGFKNFCNEVLEGYKIPEDVFLPKKNIGCHIWYGLSSENEGLLEPDLSDPEEKEFFENGIDWGAIRSRRF